VLLNSLAPVGSSSQLRFHSCAATLKLVVVEVLASGNEEDALKLYFSEKTVALHLSTHH
jgi:hypothetical protein